MKVDTTYMDEFIKGLNDGANAGDDKKKAAYYAGIQIGQQISNQMIKGINTEVYGQDSTKSISLKNFMAGFVAGTTGKTGDIKMTIAQAQMIAQSKMTRAGHGVDAGQPGSSVPSQQAGETRDEIARGGPSPPSTGEPVCERSAQLADDDPQGDDRADDGHGDLPRPWVLVLHAFPLHHRSFRLTLLTGSGTCSGTGGPSRQEQLKQLLVRQEKGGKHPGARIPGRPLHRGDLT